MEVSLEIKEEIRKTQSDLKKALRLHQIWVARLKDDETNSDIRSKIKQAEQSIVNISHLQKGVIERLRNELMMHQDRLKARNKTVNSEVDCRNIANQLRDHQRQHRTRKKSISLLKPSVLSEIQIKSDDIKSKMYLDKRDETADESGHNNGCSYMKNDEMDDDSEFILATENFSLKDEPTPRSVQNNCHNLASTLKKLKANICYGNTEITVKQPLSPQSFSSKSSSPSPIRVESSPAPSPPLDLPLPQPGDCITQETFLRIFGLITPRQRQMLEKKRDEKKKRSTTSTNKNDYVYDNFDMGQKRKKNNFPYLQQNVGPPQTRSQKMRKQLQAKRTNSNTSPSGSPSVSPPLWPTSLNLPSGLIIQAVPSPGPKLCTVCRQNDTPSLLMHCPKCKSYFHTSCSSSPSSRSPSSRSRSPINVSSDRHYNNSSTVCPECGEELKENKSNNWTVVARGYSNNNKLIEKKILQEKKRQLTSELRKLQARADTLKENIETSNIEKKQLISNQNNTRKRINTLIDFVNKFKDPTERLLVLPAVERESSRSTNESNDIEELSNGC